MGSPGMSPVLVLCPWVGEGTLIGAHLPDAEPRILAVTARRGMVLISMDVEGSWQRIGLIADLAGCFKRHGFSIDTIASSQTNVTVALDPAANHLEESALVPLLADLGRMSAPRVEGRAAAVSVVGSSVRALLHELGPILGLLRDEPVRMLAHAANDLSLTLIVDESAGSRVVQALHGALFEGDPGQAKARSASCGGSQPGV
jgi:bifunctional diaminopimelate decarboxylase / aspartate kinase